MATKNGTGRTHAHQQRTAERPEPVGSAPNRSAGNCLPWIAGEIAQLADKGRSIWRQADEGEFEDLHAAGSAVVRVFERVGWLADTMTATLGGTPLRGADAADWCMPEAVRQALGPGKLTPRPPVETADNEATSIAEPSELADLVDDIDNRVRSAVAILGNGCVDHSEEGFGALYLLQDVLPKLTSAIEMARVHS